MSPRAEGTRKALDGDSYSQVTKDHPVQWVLEMRCSITYQSLMQVKEKEKAR